MASTTLRIANAAGFYGDRISAAKQLVERGEIDVLTLEYLAELTMSILARQRAKQPTLGYAADLHPVLRSIAPAMYLRGDLSVITNAGGVNPAGCAASLVALCEEVGLAELPVAVVRGDDLLPRLEELQANGIPLAHLDMDAPLAELKRPIVAANAYLGSQPIAHAVRQGARLVLTGRVADASLLVGPAAAHFNWQWEDFDTLASATTAGHVIECGAQATGGYTTDWAQYDLTDVGYPVAEVASDGSAVITKPPGTGGAVTRRSVASQLVYEIGDPNAYLTPDVTANFASVDVTERGPDRVQLGRATGTAPPKTLKVSLAYEAGFAASGELLVYGRDAVPKARAAAKLILDRTTQTAAEPQHAQVEILGAGEGVPGGPVQQQHAREVMLRVTARDDRREVVEQFTKEIAPLITSGPAGLAGYASGRPRVRPVLAYWPTIVPRDVIEPHVEIRPAKDW